MLGAATNYWVVTSAEKSKEEDKPPELSTGFSLVLAATGLALLSAGAKKRFQMTGANGLKFQSSTCLGGHSLLPS